MIAYFVPGMVIVTETDIPVYDEGGWIKIEFCSSSKAANVFLSLFHWELDSARCIAETWRGYTKYAVGRIGGKDLLKNFDNGDKRGY